MSDEGIRIASNRGLSIAGSANPKPNEERPDDDMDIETSIESPPASASNTAQQPPEPIAPEQHAPKSIANAEHSIEGWVVIATGIHEEAREEDLQDFFADYGKVRSLHMNLDRQTGFVKGYALLEYENVDEAKAAVMEGSGKKLLGKPINVDFAFIQDEENDDEEKEGEDRSAGRQQRRRRARRDSSGDRGWTAGDSYVPGQSSHQPSGRAREMSPDRGF
ncbi:hypothetical protein IWW50_000790 [Coemansia erecta]|nr:hypothetical protein GGF43_000757 [Coemansia sp. RSA 2618]KAJ2829548.1 hypothetical protein IWW50_000790 [Coemansia erecta]